MLKKPMRPVIKILNSLAYLMFLGALTALIAWIYYIVKAVEQNEIGGPEGLGEDNMSGSVLETSSTMFQSTVASIFLYFIARHHFNCHY
jgi:hypothetical protein